METDSNGNTRERVQNETAAVHPDTGAASP